MKGMWRVIFPEQSVWFYVDRVDRISTIMTRINKTYPITYYQFEVQYCLDDDMRKFPLINSPNVLTRFHSWLMHNWGPELKVRIRVKEKDNG